MLFLEFLLAKVLKFLSEKLWIVIGICSQPSQPFLPLCLAQVTILPCRVYVLELSRLCCIAVRVRVRVSVHERLGSIRAGASTSTTETNLTHTTAIAQDANLPVVLPGYERLWRVDDDNIVFLNGIEPGVFGFGHPSRHGRHRVLVADARIDIE